MSSEAVVTSGLQIVVADSLGRITFSRQESVVCDVDGRKGPVPGSIAITTDGVDIDLSELVTPGLCWLESQDAVGSTKRVDYGIKDFDGNEFYPLGELLPGDRFVLRLSRSMLKEYPGTGTGIPALLNTLHFRAVGGSVNVLIAAFER